MVVTHEQVECTCKACERFESACDRLQHWLNTPPADRVVIKNKKAFKSTFEWHIGRQSYYFRNEFDKWVAVLNTEYDNVLKHLHLIKSQGVIEKSDLGEFFERLMKWYIIIEVGRRILEPVERRVLIEGARRALLLSGIGGTVNLTNPAFAAMAAAKAATLVKYVTESARQNLIGLTAQAIEFNWTVDSLALQLRNSLTVLPASQNRIMREAAEKLAAGVAQDKVNAWITKEMIRMKNYRALMVARTEASAAMNAGALLAYKQAGAKYVEWLALPTACPDCEDQDGRVFTIEDAEDMIPAHPNCRCTWAPIVV